MDSRIAIVSRHIVLIRYIPLSERFPQYGAILIQGELISEVRLFPADLPVSATQIEAALAQLEGWEVVDCQDLYVSAGLVDCNVRVNEEWESVEMVTLCGVSGGVTCMAVETSLYGQSFCPHSLYCDIGLLQIVSKGKQTLSAPPGFLAFKTYLCPPSALVTPGTDDLSELMSGAEDKNVPLFIDVSMPTPRMLFMSSPFRNVSLSERLQSSPLSEPTVTAGAFAHNIVSSGSESGSEEDDSISTPDQSLSSVDLQKPSTERIPTVQLSHAIPTLKPPEIPIHRKSIMRTLADGVAERVKSTKDDIEMLSQAEQVGYQGVGLTFFLNDGSESAPAVTSSIPAPSAPPLAIGGSKMFQSRMQRFRPEFVITEAEDRSEQHMDQSYLTHVANCSENWETSGVETVLAVMKEEKTGCRVHLVNLSTAGAVNKAFSKRNEVKVTCETAPHYLYFSMEEVETGDTRFKTFPPIRNKANSALLLELLKLEAIDILASHHISVPHSIKLPSSHSFRQALNGINGLGFSLSAVWSILKPHISTHFQHYFIRLSKWMSLAPAKLLGIDHIKGEIKVGLHADLVLWDPFESFEAKSRSKHGKMSPYDKKEMYGKVKAVYVRGKLAWSETQACARGTIISK